VRIHPHASGYIEFEDELDRVAQDVPEEVAGLCLDTGHMDYSGMNPIATLRRYASRTDGAPYPVLRRLR
jgi:inosose dehydratase